MVLLSCGEKHHNNDGSDHGVTKMLVIIITTTTIIVVVISVTPRNPSRKRPGSTNRRNAPVHGKSPANAEKAEALNKDGSRLETMFYLYNYIMFVTMTLATSYQ